MRNPSRDAKNFGIHSVAPTTLPVSEDKLFHTASTIARLDHSKNIVSAPVKYAPSGR